jgi:serine/threonine-protein kinase RsbT
MAAQGNNKLPVRSSEDIVLVRQAVRHRAIELGFSLVDQTKVVTAASELARNIVTYAGTGSVDIEAIHNGSRSGLQITFEDRGPGIADVELAMKDGYTTGSGLGLGLGGSKRLVHEFAINTRLGEGTTVRITKWK